jgi:transposase InsO family protein
MTLRSVADLTGVSVSTAARICRRHALNRLDRIDPPPPVRRYQREFAGELLHIDVKKLGRFDEVGHRVTRDRSIGSKHVGWDFLHVAIDDASRVTYAEILSDERKGTVTGFLQRSVAWFNKQGVTVTAVMTDNARSYLSVPFTAACRLFGIKHIRTRPYTPRTNGKAERMIQTLLREWAYRFAYTNSDQRLRWLRPYLHFYNFHRRHSALAYNPPISRLERNNVLRRNS